MQFSEEPRVPDHDSDPAHTPGDGWVDEGGASHLGPATHIYSANEGDDADADADTDTADTDDSDDPERDLGRS
ncbi:hypothetical protein [Leucobacter salsicius]|uniref:hypothetical protein n=1 Tax=Leucobacter salsicius TaxID=664638 RepID=UPI00034C551C|nr:hypothetical protein [Leucobacter salsicius]